MMAYSWLTSWFCFLVGGFGFLPLVYLNSAVCKFPWGAILEMAATISNTEFIGKSVRQKLSCETNPHRQ